MILNISQIVDLPLTFIRKAWAIDPAVDVVAADPLGRIPIFELKKDSIGAQAASQLEHYLLGHVLQDADQRCREWGEVGRKQVARGYLARLLMGAHAGDRSSIAGLKKIVGELGATRPSAIGENGKRLSRAKWGNSTTSRRSADSTRLLSGSPSPKGRRRFLRSMRFSLKPIAKGPD